MMPVIPRTLIQTSREKPTELHLQTLLKRCEGWTYRHFDDAEMYAFVEAHPMKEFPHLVEKLKSIPRGCHRADLFRYIYLYHYGGVFLDSDAMIYKPLDDLVKNYEFVSSYSIIAHAIFQGFLGVTPFHPFMYLAIYDMYHMKIECLNEHMFVCKNLYKIMKGNEWMVKPSSVYMYYEMGHTRGRCKTVTLQNIHDILLIHYFHEKEIDYTL